MSEPLTVSEIANALGVDDRTVRRWVERGLLDVIVLPHVNEGQPYRIRREILDKMLGEPGGEPTSVKSLISRT
jgi:excisionase family DNA binding protein